MANRFRYEPRTAVEKLALRLKHPRRWRSKITPSVFDNQSGARVQLACDEEAVIRRLNVRIPGQEQEWPLSPTTLDDVANAILLRRLGYVFEWARISSLEARRRTSA